MTILNIFFIAIGLAMDCFAVSISKGLSFNSSDKQSLQGVTFAWVLMMAALFGLFQGGMPLFGYFLGTFFADFFSRFAPWIALLLLAFIGGKMIYESLQPSSTDTSADTSSAPTFARDNQEYVDRAAASTSVTSSSTSPTTSQAQSPSSPSQSPTTKPFSLSILLLLAIATSIDALATGVIFIPCPEQLEIGVCIIGIVSFLFSIFGFLIGAILGKKFRFNASLVGGIILILIGLKIFIEGLFF